jgi:hypothetical protein
MRDAEGRFYVSVPQILEHLELEDTEENRELALRLVREGFRLAHPDLEIEFLCADNPGHSNN